MKGNKDGGECGEKSILCNQYYQLPPILETHEDIKFPLNGGSGNTTRVPPEEPMDEDVAQAQSMRPDQWEEMLIFLDFDREECFSSSPTRTPTI